MAMEPFEVQMRRNMETFFHSLVRNLQEQLVQDALQEFENRLRAAILKIPVDVGQYYSIERNEAEMTIRVNLGGVSKK